MRETERQDGGIQIGRRTFFSSLAILLCLMILSGVLTRVLPTGQFDHTTAEGVSTVVPGSFSFTDAPAYPVYRWFTAPVEVLFSRDNASVIMIILFILVIGGTFTVMDRCGMLQFIMGALVNRFEREKYKLMAALILFFMLFGSVFGIFEELVALVPMVILLSYALGWDSLTGLGMSALAAGFGFSCATLNPFTLGVAQQLAGLPPFSGLLFRIVVFALCYGVLLLFVRRHARRVERDPEKSPVYAEDRSARERYRGDGAERARIALPNEVYIKTSVKIFAGTLAAVILYVLTSFFVPVMSGLALPAMAVLFLTGGLISARVSRYTQYAETPTSIARDFAGGLAGIAPGAVLILFATSVKLIIENGGVMDTILYYASEAIAGVSALSSTLLIYLLVLVLNFFVGSGSAKAFLVIPIIAPLTDLVGITRQVAVQAFCFGDGFTNLLYPTNPVLMITLGVTVVSYGKWLKWSLPLQGIMFAGSVLALGVAVAIGY